MEDLNELKEKIEDKYYSEIFSIVENYLNENKEEFCPEDSFYICCWHWFILVIKQFEIINISYINNSVKREIELIIKSKIAAICKADIGYDFLFEESFRIVACLNENTERLEVVYIGLCMENNE